MVAKITSKTIDPREHSNYERWELPHVNEPAVSSMATVEELESIQKQAYDEAYDKAYHKAHDEGYAQGQKEGYQQKTEELDGQISSLKSIIEVLTEPLKEIDDDVVNQLAELSMVVAKQVVRRELHTEQGEIVGIVREAMTALPASTRKINLHIHPDDSELIRNAFSLGDNDDSDELRWKLTEDPIITRGGCKISSENSRIDATVEARLNRVISTLLGDERESDD